MTGRYKAYPEYRKSQIEWMHDVPVHWNNVPLKYMAIEDKSLFLDGDWIESKDISNEGIRYITTGNVGEGIYKEQGAGFISDETFKKLACTEVFEGDLLLSRLNAPIGRACIVPNLSSRIVTSVDNVIFRPDSLYNKQFLVYLFSSASYFKHTSNLARGATMQRISRGLLGNIRVVVPPLLEQQKIADFLDHETAKIDTLITQQEKLIELLREKRQAVISHAVTKGLNPDAPKKDSGVEWLGEVPEHWVVSKLKNHTRQIVDGAHFTPTYSEAGIPFLRVTDVTSKSIDFKQIKYIPESEHKELIKRCNPQKGDLLLSKNGTIGVPKVIDWDFDFSIFVSLCLIKFKDSLLSTYSSYVFESRQIEEQINGGIKQSTVINLHLDKIENFYFSIPPVEEQQAIVFELDRKTKQLDLLISKAEKAIALIKERKTALISAAVTGKIDVRDWSAN